MGQLQIRRIRNIQLIGLQGTKKPLSEGERLFYFSPVSRAKREPKRKKNLLSLSRSER